MAKALELKTFEELVTMGSEIELNALINGEGNIRSRVFRIMELAVLWKQEQLIAAGKLKR